MLWWTLRKYRGKDGNASYEACGKIATLARILGEHRDLCNAKKLIKLLQALGKGRDGPPN
jgi:hypothetical protein